MSYASHASASAYCWTSPRCVWHYHEPFAAWACARTAIALGQHSVAIHHFERGLRALVQLVARAAARRSTRTLARSLHRLRSEIKEQRGTRLEVSCLMTNHEKGTLEAKNVRYCDAKTKAKTTKTPNSHNLVNMQNLQAIQFANRTRINQHAHCRHSICQSLTTVVDHWSPRPSSRNQYRCCCSA